MAIRGKKPKKTNVTVKSTRGPKPRKTKIRIKK